MMVEIGQLERLVVFLGHPIYGLTVVLFVLLLSSSIGSLYSHQIGRWIWLLPCILAAFILVGPLFTRSLAAASTPLRISVSAAMLFPSGFFGYIVALTALKTPVPNTVGALYERPGGRRPPLQGSNV